ncbi:uncharacterized protein LOC118198527 isoform X3 [Stegodyphus dumicola]|uniref:uncharacterized protein LOC118198527 isoform X3 n=1 Tax=Stegodyphus dumicola TaxID=202533 RepID=UPI0015AE755C|nr:uncharacterized protein LOC118198527 isoform X3 [Stegodyphus dumicola]
MALQSEVSPPLVGDANKDTKIDGDTKSTDDNESSQSTDEDVDLEEGEILDSGAEEEEEKKDFTNSSLKEALDKSCLQSIEQLISQSKNLDTSLPKPSKPVSPRKLNKLAAKYMDHDQILDNSDQEDGWYPSPSKYKPKFEEKPIDYRMELAAYRGTPPSSPDHKKKDEKRKKRSSKKSKKTSRKTIKRKDIKGLRVMKYKKESVKGRICKFFKEGKCAKGADCLFSHASPASYKKKELCKFYLNGHCNKGKECLYMHSEFPCKFYHTGSECYAKEDCRFSHAPLTDEMKRILADYLKLHHGDDDHEGRKRRVSSSPEPKGSAPKRPCLLGSPPRHIREAEETKRWQEEMKLLQQQNHPGFEIRISPNRESSSPPQCPKPNFYQETLPSTPPQKRRTAPEASTPLAHPSGFPQSSAFPKSNNSGMFIEGSPKIYQYDEEYTEEMDVSSAKQDTSNDFSWKNVHNLVHVPADQQELDFTSDVKFDETTQFSEMESSTDCPPVLSPGPIVPSAVENKDNESNDTSNQESSKTGDDGISAVATSNSSSDPPAPPIVIPSHLPRKQRELFMRIQQHQKKNAVITENIDISSSPSTADIAESQIKKEDSEVEEEKPETDKTDSKWYSSEDDDDDADQPLTDVLKKLRQTPPPVAKETESKPTVNLMEMLNKIQKNTLERNKAAVDTKPPQDNFWQNILMGAVPSSQPLIPALSTVSSESKRRTLLPDPQPLPVPAVKKEPVVPKDPRLKNRDPRTLANSNTSNNAANVPKTTASETNNLLLNTTPVQDMKSLLSKTTSVTSELPKENIPYRLHGIYTTPPNYTPYIHASQSNPKLLDDPRLRKHLNLTQSNESSLKNTKELDPIKSEPKDVPPIPKSLLKYEKPDSLNINIFETSSLKSSNEDAQDCKPQPPNMRKLIDPRIRRRDSHSNSGSDTPPHLTIVETSSPLQEFKTAPVLENALLDPVFEKKWLPPVLEKNWTPPVLEKNLYDVVIKKEIDSDSEDSPDPPRLEISESPIETISILSKKEETVKSEKMMSDRDKSVPPLVSPLIVKRGKPTPASHLPKAIADPRMAKLHHPLDPRRPRAAFTDSNSKVIVERRKVENERPPDKNSINELKSSGDLSLTKNEGKETVNAAETDDKQKTVKNIPKKCKLPEKSEEKKKTVHRNRKSSMDYASPLNSCDDTNSNKSLNYNSYNQRPNQRTVKPITDTESLTSSSAPEVSENTIISDYLLSDNSNIEGDNIDVNLKDMFKTIDPTASPFC